MLKIYVCNLWKNLHIGAKVKFEGGVFETEDPEIQALIERNNAFGSAIHFRDSEEEMARIGRERDELTASEKARRRQGILDELKAEEEEAKKKAGKEADDEAEAKRKRKAAAEIKVVDKVVDEEKNKGGRK